MTTVARTKDESVFSEVKDILRRLHIPYSYKTGKVNEVIVRECYKDFAIRKLLQIFNREALFTPTDGRH